MPTTLRPAGLLAAVACLFVTATPARAVDEVIDSVMFADPDLPRARVVKVFPPRLTALWLRALGRPENDLKCQAAATIALAHRRGMPGLETTVGPLLRALDQDGQHPTVRLAVARALVTLDARQAAPNLFRHAQTDGIDMRNLVEPALARWDYRPARAAWLERLNQPGLPGYGWLLALRGLGAVREAKAVPRLRELTLAPATDPIVRLEAARALGLIRTEGLEEDAERLAAEKAVPGGAAQLAAASLLRKHRGERAARVLQRLAVGAEPAAAAAALEGLLEADPRRVLTVLSQVLASPDATVRGLGVEAHRRCPRPEDIAPVAELLDDPHPGVRVGARKALLEAARASHGEAVRRQAAGLLAGARWRALEQAAILLTVLDHKPSAPRFVELLQFDRPEVFVAAAWGLRRLAVPETLPAQLREIERRWDRSLKPRESGPDAQIDLQVAQLAQSLGQARYEPAGAVLARFVPKRWNIGPESRAAAVWALGLIHAKDPPATLVQELIGRVSDESTIMEENLHVRRMAAVSLGRMRAQEAVDAVKKYYGGRLTTEPFPNACGWALEQLTGAKLPRSGTVEAVQGGWFLEAKD